MRAAWLLLVGASLAGCAGGTGGEAGHAVQDDGHLQHMMQDVTFFEQTVEVEETVAGEFGPQDHSAIQSVFFTAGQPTTAVHNYNITTEIPDGIPVFVEIEVTEGDGVYAWLTTSDPASIWTSDCGACEGGTVGTEWSGAVIDSGQAHVINVWYSGPDVPEAMPYEVQYRISAAPERIPSGVVVEVDLPQEGSHILFEAVEGTMPDVMVFGPDDRFVTILPSDDPQMVIEENQSTGAYVFLPTGHGAFYTLRSGGDIPADERLDVQARILEQVIQTDGPRPAGTSGTYDVDLDVQPLQAAILMFGGVAGKSSIEMTGPDGFRLAASTPQGPVNVGFGAFTLTRMGDPALAPGTYTVSWMSDVNDGSAQVQEFFVLYGR